METYITNSNSKNIIFKMDISDLEIDGEIYKIEFKWFNNFEVKFLLAFKLLYSDPVKFFENYKKKDTPLDTKTWAFEGISPAFHHSCNCERLNSDYLNIKIPEKIRKQGETKIKEFRIWVKENISSLEHSPSFFFDKMRWKFGLDEEVEKIHKSNGGVISQINYDLEELELSINNLIQEANNFYTKNEKNKFVLENFGKESKWYLKGREFNVFPPFKMRDKDIWEILKEFDDNFKTPIKYLLQEYYRVKYNPELKFKGHLLEQLGFKSCKKCVNNNEQLSTLKDDNILAVSEEFSRDSSIINEVLALDWMWLDKASSEAFSKITPIRIEKTNEEVRNLAFLLQIYVTKDIRRVSKFKLLFHEVENSKGETIYYEKRTCAIQIPTNILSLDDIVNRLNKFPNAIIYRIVNRKIILNDFEEDLYIRYGESILDELRRKSLKMVLANKGYYVRYFFSKTNRPDIFRE